MCIDVIQFERFSWEQLVETIMINSDYNSSPAMMKAIIVPLCMGHPLSFNSVYNGCYASGFGMFSKI